MNTDKHRFLICVNQCHLHCHLHCAQTQVIRSAVQVSSVSNSKGCV
jgi:hypothetical protein